MKLDFDRSLDLPVSADRAWAFLDRIEKVAACMPGASITEKIDDTHYRGVVSVRLGPVNMSFQGVIEILSRDPATRTIGLAGKGADKSGSSVAEMQLTAGVVATGAETSRLTGKSSVDVSGKVAAMGQRLMTSVSEQLIKEFFANLLTNVQAEPATATPVSPASPLAASVSSVQASPKAKPSLAAEPVTAAPAKSLDGFAFIWAVLKSFFAGLFRGRSASS